MVHSPLTTRFALTSDYSSRGGVTVDSIGHHHTAGTSLEVALDLFQPGGRTVSPNYCIRGKDIVLVVPEEYRAWTSADAWADGRSITYEIVNSTGSPYWQFDPDTIASVIALDRDIMRRYPAVAARHAVPGFWEHKNLYEWFGRSYATSCAGPSFDIGHIINSAAAPASAPKPKEIKVQALNYADPRTATSLEPGGSMILSNASLRHQDITGGLGGGVYGFAAHVYAEGTHGDVVELRLEWRNRDTGKVSPHYIERIPVDGDGLVRATRVFQRTVDAASAVVLRASAAGENDAPVNVSLLSVDVSRYIVA